MCVVWIFESGFSTSTFYFDCVFFIFLFFYSSVVNDDTLITQWMPAVSVCFRLAGKQPLEFESKPSSSVIGCAPCVEYENNTWQFNAETLQLRNSNPNTPGVWHTAEPSSDACRCASARSAPPDFSQASQPLNSITKLQCVTLLTDMTWISLRQSKNLGDICCLVNCNLLFSQ